MLVFPMRNGCVGGFTNATAQPKWFRVAVEYRLNCNIAKITGSLFWMELGHSLLTQAKCRNPVQGCVQTSFF